MSYPLQIENVGEDVYILMSRGHHDPHEFMRKVREHYTWPLGMPEHKWVKAVPSRNEEYRCIYAFVKEGTRGAFPATYTTEAWHEDSYERRAAIDAARLSTTPGDKA